MAGADSEGAPERSAAPSADEVWRGILLGTDPRYRDSKALFTKLPGNPRCYMCSAPFKGPGSVVARRMGRRPWAKNPHYCSMCFQVIEHQHGGAEIDCTLLFADVRGSTALAETMRPSEFRAILNRFYDAAAEVLHEHDAILDKFVGDEVVAIFIPALSGDRHAVRAVMAGQALLRATGHGDAAGPWLPLGVGIHSGVAYVGAVGRTRGERCRAPRPGVEGQVDARPGCRPRRDVDGADLTRGGHLAKGSIRHQRHGQPRPETAVE